ncbi:unnamed protein product [Paramecium pentaurelia]|uniref:Uncharacterized protein n=1 Tax=Paramecium pentaurelia TaxID=43138 RepID=A0A8S1T4M4_9CILI|nr:unnamed protein product [Paramecium pentaurelia]
MIRQQMIEKEEEFVCSMNHKLPIYMVISDKSVEKNKRLLCNECMDNLESNLNNVMSFEKVALLIEENQKKKVEQVEYYIMKNIKQIDELQKTLYQLKSHIIQQLDQLIGNTDEWIKCLEQIGQQNVNYSFFEQLDNLINQVQIQQFDYKSLIAQINSINHSHNQKIINKLNQFKLFEFTNKCEQLLINLSSINQQQDLIQQINIIQELQQIDIVQLKQYDLEFKLIDDLNRLTFVILFKDIIIWNFTQGRLLLSFRFKVHQSSVKCLVYSKKLNCFISGSWDKSIICWKQINNNEWKWSQPYQQHNDQVSCLILNKQEDQLISRGRDYSIKIWNVDFIKNELTYLYSLDNTAAVHSLSLNQSETMLASSAQSRYLIWKKGVNKKWGFKCKQDVTQGYKIYFMDDQQFLWVTKDKNIDLIFNFELQNGVFKQNLDKTIHLNTKQSCEDDWTNFPIIYNKDKNMLLVRHKHHIYIISKANEGNFKIIGSLNCEIKEIYGTMTDNAQYLVFWDKKQQKYSSYELLQK